MLLHCATHLHLSHRATGRTCADTAATLYTDNGGTPLLVGTCQFTDTWDLVFLLPGLSYDITIVATSAIGGVSAPGCASDKVTFSTMPTVPTLMCKDLIATSGIVNVSWTFVYNINVDNDQDDQPISLLVTPDVSPVIEFLYQPIIVSTNLYLVQLHLVLEPLDHLKFIISSVPSIDMMPSTYSFPMYIDQQKVSVVINNIKACIVHASNAYGTSQPVAVTWIDTGEVLG
eukprot:Em0006g534a